MYGLDGMKGSIAPGYDADLVVWYPSGHGKGKRTIKNEILHHGIDYTPFEGLDVVNWPRFTVLRGVLKWNCDKESGEGHMKGIVGEPGDGRFLRRGKGAVLVGRTGHIVPGMKVGERELWMSA